MYICTVIITTFVTIKNFEIMDFYDTIMVGSFVMALMLAPFVVGTFNPVLWVFYLFLCTVFTPVIGIPLYKAVFR